MPNELMVLPKQFTPSSGTPFGEFLEWLEHFAPKPRYLPDGTRLVGPPLMEIVSYGMWVVTLKSAAKLGVELQTTAQVGLVASRVDRLVNAGLLYRHKSSLRAARAFQRQVLAAIDLAIECGARPGMKITPTAWSSLAAGSTDRLRREVEAQEAPDSGPLSSLVQMPSALFFADIMRAAGELRVELMELRAEFRTNNVAFRTEIPIVEGSRRKIAKEFRYLAPVGAGPVIDALDIAQDEVYLDPKRAVMMPKFLRQAIRDQRVLRKLPLRLGEVPVDALVSVGDESFSSDIRDFWLDRQVQIAAADLEDRDWISGLRDYQRAEKAIRARPEAEVIDAFFQRMDERGMQLDADGRTRLAALARQRIRAYQYREESPSRSRKNGFGIPLVNISGEEVTLLPERALEIATGMDPEFKAMSFESDDARRRYIREEVYGNILWDGLVGSESFEAILVAGILTPRQIVEGVIKMPPKDQPEALRRLFAAELVDRAGMSRLIEKRLCELSPKLIEKHGALIAPKLLEKYLPNALMSMELDARSWEGIQAKWLVEAFALLPSGKAREILLDKKLRRSIANNLISETVTEADRASIRILDRTMSRFWVHLTRGMWWRYVLAVEVLARKDEYQNLEDADYYRVPWEQLHQASDAHALPLMESRGEMTPEQLLEIISEHPEDEVFCWLYADKSKAQRERMLAKYQIARQRYYEVHGADRASEP